MTRYTVIGGQGFVGSRLVARLRSSGHEVVVPPRQACDALIGPDLGRIVYCAGLTADFAARPFATIEAHVALLARLLERGRFSHLTYLSSTRLYDALPAGLVDEQAVLRLSPHQPRHLYDLSKALGENLCLTTAAGRSAVARLSCVFDRSADAPGFLPDWLRRAETARDILLDSAPGFARDYVHLDDVAAALERISAGGADGIFNLASGENVSNGDLATVFDTAGWRIAFTRNDQPPGTPVCDIGRLRGLGIEPGRVRDLVAGYLKDIGCISAS